MQTKYVVVHMVLMKDGAYTLDLAGVYEKPEHVINILENGQTLCGEPVNRGMITLPCEQFDNLNKLGEAWGDYKGTKSENVHVMKAWKVNVNEYAPAIDERYK